MADLRSVPDNLFDPETGELTKNLPCPHCAESARQVAGLETEIRAWRSRYSKLREDKAAEAEGHTLWGLAIALFLEWRIATGHIRSSWTAARFWLCHPYLEREKYTACRYAVWGIAAAPNTKQITATYEEVFDSWELCFRSQDTFERYANRGAALFGRQLPIPAAMEVPKWLRVPAGARLGSVLDEG